MRQEGVYLRRGTLIVPDPNSFGGPVLLSTLDDSGFHEIPLTHIYAENSRGVGLSDMAQCIIDGGINRANCGLSNHVLEAMCAFHESSDTGVYYKMKSPFSKPKAFPVGLLNGKVVCFVFSCISHTTGDVERISINFCRN
jgi:hypothetical protein